MRPAVIRVRILATFVGKGGKNTRSLTNHHKKKSRGVRSGERGGYALGELLEHVQIHDMKKKGPYTITCIKLAAFSYIMTVQNVVYVLYINLYTLSKL
jgi:hypothetical protein